MKHEHIQDYLRTQGLRGLSADETAVAAAAAQTVLAVGNGAVEKEWADYDVEGVSAPDLLQHDEPQQCLRQIFLALDAALSRGIGGCAAAVYAVLPASQAGAGENALWRLVSWGKTLPHFCPINDENGRSFLPCRSAQTGWLNVLDDTGEWLADGSLQGEQPGLSQIALPLCRNDGRVIGVLYAADEAAGAFGHDRLAQWVGLALAVAEYLQTCLPDADGDAQDAIG